MYKKLLAEIKKLELLKQKKIDVKASLEKEIKDINSDLKTKYEAKTKFEEAEKAAARAMGISDNEEG